ncbi:tRNA acetyltransferase TAN1 [Paragonimus westermani]|uniref:tRNA acetyltransferase TAN1 n=1 Tax=Paragonimus westermani TaxID=34504 RepID=A0A5J4N3C8_9TREM|nr:tRNA acetyltransferase TAN1 [Paragonimus westermani]KAA3677196.1 tRNA acetyltransferase TAN1 [Paragonimus westermani]
MGLGGTNPDKRKRKIYYRKCAAAMKRQKLTGTVDGTNFIPTTPKSLTPGMTGYLVTCNQKERFALLEAFRLLNDALQRCSGHDSSERPTASNVSDLPGDQRSSPSLNVGKEEAEEEDDDILAQLKRENVNGDITPNINKSVPPRFSFYSVRSGVSNCLFVLHYADNFSPTALANSVFEHLLSTKVPNSRHVLRLLPVAATCSANASDINACVKKVWSGFLKITIPPDVKGYAVPVGQRGTNEQSVGNDSVRPCDQQSNSECLHRHCPTVPSQVAEQTTLEGPKTFLVLFKARNYDRLSRDNAIEATVDAVRAVSPSWRISPHSPSVMIFVNVLRNVACISMLEHFDRYRKYNIAELLVSDTAEPQQPDVSQHD